MRSARQISRRTVLRGLGTAIALPWLEAMSTTAALAAPAGAAGKAATAPLRMAFFYVPNGAHMADWTPKEVGTDFTLPYILEPVSAFKDDLLVMTGLTQKNGFALGDGGGDHARALSTFLTGCHPLKTDGANIRVGVSVDQIAALKVGGQTRFPSLELGIDRGAQSGSCDTGYSCAYSSNISWRTESTPMAKEVNPRLVFDRLFTSQNATGTAASRARRDFYKKSILDYVAEDAATLKGRLGITDQRKVEEYLTAVREIERRVDRASNQTGGDLPQIARPSGVPRDFQEHVHLMCDLMVLAFQGDVTRISTFMFANEGSNRSYPVIDVPEGHHELSHHGGDPKKHEKIKRINHLHVSQFAYFLGKLKAIKEGEGTLLDNAMIVYGSGISDGNRHNHDDLPILVAGKGGGSLQTGRHLKVADNTPLNNLYLSLLDRMGAPVDRFGDSTGRVEGL
ncbi:DUF1552 domain-containing protein [Singulisphaera acidiphila]|uniref:DUF1552 domain-containing protein n=1 Tax=Singulisphaera acidiphila (strain ATCC BAA-1392 / DSM 18658 / VKM B-2454 / MOB10) TaxID=886293 RepID=L0DNQ9_SINAD|nr:DUF1552 domain-containing protein [Singulisphaera acidiphila]AGA30450.1 Protein of unknown function (DUF1552) [Singulisphaera acidiphila DSM 18658]